MIVSMTKPQTSVRHGALKLHRVPGFGEVSLPLHQPVKPCFPPIPQTGTGGAIKYLTLGVAALSTRSTRRGGARNRADRTSDALKPAQVRNLIDAAHHANVIGLPFTRMISIHWQSAGIPLPGMAKATGRFTDLMAKALARHGSGTAWLWVHENGDGKGGHCHMLAHVPAGLVQTISGLQRNWLRRITGKPYRARVIYSKPIGGRLGLEHNNPDLHAVNLEKALSYILKGADADAAAQFALVRLEPGGTIIGKRCGISENIAAKARSTP